MSKPAWILLLTLQLFFIPNTVASIGDRSQYYKQCMTKCRIDSCNNDDTFKTQPSVSLLLLRWSCKEDCSYACTWHTVNYFTTHGLKVPQFHGKWPFIRLLGCQEPASVLFSIFNFYSHWRLYRQFKKNVNSTYPMFYVWSCFSIMCLNGWFWSSIFHARDRPFTEVMDYSCAFAIVLTLLYSTMLRIIYKNGVARLFITCAYVSILYTHLSHLWSGQINYGYNMKFNIATGFLTFATTMIWWHRNRRKLRHMYLIGWFNILTVLVTLLEVADFPPIFWIFDAHSLWHAATAPLVILLYRFAILDCIYLKSSYSKLVLSSDHIH